MNISINRRLDNCSAIFDYLIGRHVEIHLIFRGAERRETPHVQVPTKGDEGKFVVILGMRECANLCSTLKFELQGV